MRCRNAAVTCARAAPVASAGRIQTRIYQGVISLTLIAAVIAVIGVVVAIISLVVALHAVRN
jgi:hypothetical protein